jgi:hypothetical protein
VKNLAHSASFESLDKNAPSKGGIKHLGLGDGLGNHLTGRRRCGHRLCDDNRGYNPTARVGLVE